MFTVEAKELVVASFGDCYFIFGGLELISHENSTRDVWSSSCNMEPERYHHPCIPVFFGGHHFFQFLSLKMLQAFLESSVEFMAQVVTYNFSSRHQ